MLKLTLVTPSKKLVTDTEVEEVFVPAFRGELNILPGHAALVTSLGSGILKYRLKGENRLHAVAISWGYCEVADDNVSVLADSADLAEEIDANLEKATLNDLETKLTAGELSPEEMNNLNRLVRLGQTRLQLLEESAHGAFGPHT